MAAPLGAPPGAPPAVPLGVFDRDRLIARTSVHAALRAALASDRMRGVANSDLRRALEEALREELFPAIRRVAADTGASISLSYRPPERAGAPGAGPGAAGAPPGGVEPGGAAPAAQKDMATYSQVIEDNVRLFLRAVYRSAYRSYGRRRRAFTSSSSSHSGSESDSASASVPEPPPDMNSGRLVPRPEVLPIACIENLTLVGFGKRFPASDDGQGPQPDSEEEEEEYE